MKHPDTHTIHLSPDYPVVLDKLDIGLIYDIFTEKANDDCEYATLATQEDFDRW